jgi:predicted lipoprotein with Yx(FWY)xxD motif
MGLRKARARTGKTATMTGRTRAALLASAGTLAAVALAVSTFASSAPASAKSSGKAVTIKAVVVPKLGKVLATNAGLTLYRFSVDPVDQATCTATCAKIWPPLLLPKGVSHIKAPHGVKGFSLMRVKGGRLQVFFHNHALYTFVSDKKGTAAGQGVENDWFAVLSNGKSSALISSTPTTPTSSSTAPPATTATPGTTAPKTTTPTTSMSTSNAGSTGTTTPPVTKSTTPPVTQPTSPSTTQPPTTTTTQPATTTTTGGYGY